MLDSFDAAALVAAAQFKYIMFFHQCAVPLLMMMTLITMNYADDSGYQLVVVVDDDALVRPMSMERNEALY